MALLMNLCVGLFLAVGLGTAIGLPLTFSSSKDGRSGGGTSTDGRTLKIVECSEGEESAVQSVLFGDEGNSFCGKVQRPGQVSLEPGEVSESLSKLFKNMWKSGTENGHTKSDSDGKATCVFGGSGWILDQSNQGEYLGYCPDRGQHSTKLEHGILIEKDRGSSESINLRSCSGNCFSQPEESAMSGNIGKWNAKIENGIDIVFIKKS